MKTVFGIRRHSEFSEIDEVMVVCLTEQRAFNLIESYKEADKTSTNKSGEIYYFVELLELDEEQE